MKRVVLLRHAKAVAEAAGGDFDRALSPEGRSDMALVADALRALPVRPDSAVVSPARRTRETWELAGLTDVALRFVQAVYDADPETLLSVLREGPEGSDVAILVGHNPGIEELAGNLLASPDPDLGRGMPTAAAAVLTCPVELWSALEYGSASLERYVTPASLRAARA